MTLKDFLSKLEKQPETLLFKDSIEVIEATYNFTPTTFNNGEVTNNAGQNNGSCKIFGFGKAQNLSKESTLACFGEIYRGVYDTPNGTDHQNIRNFMQYGWEGLTFEDEKLPLEKK